MAPMVDKAMDAMAAVDALPIRSGSPLFTAIATVRASAPVDNTVIFANASPDAIDGLRRNASEISSWIAPAAPPIPLDAIVIVNESSVLLMIFLSLNFKHLLDV
jgi:hypothetical protein